MTITEKVNVFMRFRRACLTETGPMNLNTPEGEALTRIRRIGQLQQDFREEHIHTSMSVYRIEFYMREAAILGFHDLRELDNWKPTDQEVELVLDSALVNHW